MNNYKKSIDQIHAPKSLIEDTLKTIHEEEKSEDTPSDTCVFRSKKSRKWVGISTFATVAAAITLIITLNITSGNRIHLVYNTVSSDIVRPITEKQTESNMDADTYSEYLGLDLLHLVENAELIKTEIHVETEGSEITEDEGCAYYNVGGEQLMIKVSKTLDIIPKDLAEGNASELDGQTIFAGTGENDREHMAAFTWNGISFYLISYSMEQDEFETFLLDFFEN